MRPSQQKNRMRGRGRKQPNPLSRNYESNGPDVKIRGNASHIADKYAALARDAAASGDRVMSENYLQHAEHYNRIIAAAAAANSRNEENAAGKGPQPDVAESGQGDDSSRQEAATNDRKGGSDRGGAERASRDDNQRVGEDNQDGGNRPKREARGKRRPKKSEEETGEEKTNGAAAAANGGDGDSQNQEITEDAAKLPGNLIGVGGNGSASETGASQDD